MYRYSDMNVFSEYCSDTISHLLYLVLAFLSFLSLSLSLFLARFFILSQTETKEKTHSYCFEMRDITYTYISSRYILFYQILSFLSYLFLHKCLHYITLLMITVMRLPYLSSFYAIISYRRRERRTNGSRIGKESEKKVFVKKGRDGREKER